MHASWALFALVSILAWGILGIVQKLATNIISSESVLFWTVIGFMVPQPILYSGSPFAYPTRPLIWGLINGFTNGLGVWLLMAAMRAGGKASIVLPITALYPLFFAILAPLVLHESLSALQAAGVAFGTASIILLSSDAHGH
jgi:bacterial/archaeal transporter family protein